MFQAIVAKQYDMNTRFLKATLTDCGSVVNVPCSDDVKVVINAARKDGQSKGFDGEVNEDGTVTVPLHSWMLELEGLVTCDISVIKTAESNNKKLTTTSFDLLVEKAAYGGEDITTDPQYDVLVELIERVEDLGGGSGGVVDQTYNPESENAQSGIAVNEALYIKKEIPAETIECVVFKENYEPADGVYKITSTDFGDAIFLYGDFGMVVINNNDSMESATLHKGEYFYIELGDSMSSTVYGASKLIVYTPKYAIRKTQTFSDEARLLLEDNVEYIADRPICCLSVEYPKKFSSSITFTVGVPSPDMWFYFPDTTKYIGGAPDFKPGQTWKLDIKDGVMVAGLVEGNIIDIPAIRGVNETKTNNTFANALKGKARGQYITLDDISPIEHNLSVKIESRNMIPYPYPYPLSQSTFTRDGITFTVFDDGSILINGTAASTLKLQLVQYANPLTLEAGTYTLSGVTGKVEGVDMWLRRCIDGVEKGDVLTRNTITTTETMQFGIYLLISNGTTVDNLLLEPQLERGSTETGFTPFISNLKDTTLLTSGKNLLNYNPANAGGNVTVLEQMKNGVIVQGIVGAEPGAGAWSNGWYCFTPNEKVVRGVPYVVSCDFTFIEDPYRPDTLTMVKNRFRIEMEAVGGGTSNASSSTSQAFRPEVGVKQRIYRTFVPDCDAVKFFVPACSGTIKVENFMLAVGTTEGVATEYEPYSKDSAEYTPNEDGTVEGVTSISPNMTLVPTTGVMIAECEYNRDINKAFAELQQAIISLGGNI